MIKIIYEDEDILVIDKPAGITVNKADTTKGEETVQDWAEKYIKVSEVSKAKKEKASDTSDTFDTYDTFFQRAGIVHRLDKETSGVLIIAKNPEAFADLQRQFKERTVKKTYLALAHGRVTPEEGEINVPVGRLPWNRRQFGVVAGGREARTKYKTISKFKMQNAKLEDTLTLLELYPETGRTHQIRVHLKYIGYPIFADFLYAGRKTQRNDRKFLSRVFLHASNISFDHPETKKRMTLKSDLPEELQRIIKNINERQG